MRGTRPHACCRQPRPDDVASFEALVMVGAVSCSARALHLFPMAVASPSRRGSSEARLDMAELSWSNSLGHAWWLAFIALRGVTRFPRGQGKSDTGFPHARARLLLVEECHPVHDSRAVPLCSTANPAPGAVLSHQTTADFSHSHRKGRRMSRISPSGVPNSPDGPQPCTQLPV